MNPIQRAKNAILGVPKKKVAYKPDQGVKQDDDLLQPLLNQSSSRTNTVGSAPALASPASAGTTTAVTNPSAGPPGTLMAADYRGDPLAAMTDYQPLNLRRTGYVLPRMQPSRLDPGYNFVFDQSVATDLKIVPWTVRDLNREPITAWLTSYEAEDGDFRNEMNGLLEGESGGRKSDVTFYHPHVGSHIRETEITLWEAAVIMAGVNHSSNAFGRLLVLRGPNAIQELVGKLGRRFFTPQTMVRAVYHCAIRSIASDGDNVNAALCGRTLVASALPYVDADAESLVHKGKKGLWSKEYQDIYHYINDHYMNHCPTANDKFRYQLEVAQDLAAMSAILEGALVHYLITVIDESDQAQRDRAQAVTSVAIVGLSVGLGAISHFPPLVLAAIPLLDIAKTRFIDRKYPVREYGKKMAHMSVVRRAKLQSVYVARFANGVSPSPDQTADRRKLIDTYLDTEDSVHGLLGLA